MDLSSLDTTLPPALADAERDMGDKFRGAAMSITQLYKSSLGYTKQAYQAGYSAALADVLSKVQSDIGAGEDAAAALARLMDWSEARQAAIRTFAEDDEAPPRPASAAPSSSSALKQPGPQRPSSAPALERDLRERERSRREPGPSSLRNAAGPSGDAMEDDTAVTPAPRRTAASVSTILDRAPDIPASSSPLPSPSHHNPRPMITAPRTQRSVSRNVVPTSTFNFALPATLSIPAIELPPAGGPVQTVPTGSKRPMIDAEMSEDPATPRQGRGKRRGAVGEEDKERNGRKPRRGGQA